MTDTLTTHWLSLAYQRGKKAGEAAATYTEIPQPPPSGVPDAEALIALIEDNAPEAELFLPSRPDLSAEWGGSETSRSLVRAVTGSDPHDLHDFDDEAICDAWERGVADHFYKACVAELRRKSEGRMA
jgi:hypothetical protein